MSNLLTHFPETNKLTKVVATRARNGRIVYNAFFEDGALHIIRTSSRVYRSVVQAADGRGKGNCEFIFSAKASPSLRSWERERMIVMVEIINHATA